MGRDPKIILEEIAYRASSVRREYDGPIPVNVIDEAVEYIDERVSELCDVSNQIRESQKSKGH